MKIIKSFKGKYFFLSNFYPVKIMYNGLVYLNSEAAFQAQKCITDNERIQFTTLNPSEAKRLGRSINLRPDWEQIKISVMEDIVRCKFIQNDDLRKQLIDTKGMVLEEGNTWHDTFWGVDHISRLGRNNLGTILMNIRNEFIKNDIV